MPYETAIEILDDYIRVEISGDRRPGHEVADAIHSGRQMSAACKKHGVRRVLVIFKLTGRLPATDAHEIYSNPEAFGWTRDIKVALIDKNPDSKEDSLFSETVAVNRAYDTRVLDNENEALEWLLDN
jgi:hypothetical protein